MTAKWMTPTSFWTVVLVLTVEIVAWPSSVDAGWDACSREPPDTEAARTPGDNGFRIKIAGRPQPERYTPGQVYTGERSLDCG